jgi:uncharacterized protein (DUF169 family)
MKYTIKDYQNIGRKLKERLDLETEIVAVKFIKNVSEIPDGFLRPFKDTGKKMTLCMGMSAARREGTNVALTPEDNPCMINGALGWAKVPLLTTLGSQTTNKWQKSLLSVIKLNNARLRLGGYMANWPWSTFLGHKGFILAPLSRTPFIPDTALFYGYPEQIMHVTHSLGYEGKYAPRAAMCGFGESCWAGALFPLTSKRPVFVLLGTGDRIFGRAKKHEVGIGMPGSMIFYMDKYLYKSGGGFSIKDAIQNPPTNVDENTFPGWKEVYDVMKY